jgi:hypothetical protein
MFLEKYRQVSSRLDTIETELKAYDELLAKSHGQPPHRERASSPLVHHFRQVAEEGVRKILEQLHYLTSDPEEKVIQDSSPRAALLFRRIAALQHGLSVTGHKDMLVCPHCRDDHSEEDEDHPRGAIDRPAMPTPPLEITGVSIAAYLRELQPWLQASFDDLLEDLAPKIPRAPDRYILGDHGQVRHASNSLFRLIELQTGWKYLTEHEGPEWTSWRVGAQRHYLLERARSLYITICQPEAAESGSHSVLQLLTGQLHNPDGP